MVIMMIWWYKPNHIEMLPSSVQAGSHIASQEWRYNMFQLGYLYVHRWTPPSLGQRMVCRLLCRQATNRISADYLSIESLGRDIGETEINIYLAFSKIYLKYLRGASHLALISMPQVLRKTTLWMDSLFLFLIWPDLFICYFCLCHPFQQTFTSIYFRYSFSTPVHEILSENHGDHGGNFSHA